MKREGVLFYMQNDKINIYLVNSKREITKAIDTSRFFKFGNISDVELFGSALETFINDIHLGLLKPKVIVLYNENTTCDIKYLYKQGLEILNYESIDFIGLNSILKAINSDRRLVLFDKDYYTIPSLGQKLRSLDCIDFDPILIGKKSGHELHYVDSNIVWSTFKSRFTKQ